MQNRQREDPLDPFPFYRLMRESQPVFYNQQRERWFVFRYAEVEQVLNNTAVFSSARQPAQTNLLNMDPPQHRRFRALVTQAFTPRAVAQLADRIVQIVTTLLDNVAPGGMIDVIDHLAYPLPVIVIAELLGIPQEDRTLFKAWSDEVIESMENQNEQMNDYFLRVIEARRKHPQNDLISVLLNAQIDGQHLTPSELLGFCILLLVAGNETTTNLIGNALLCFDEHPDVLQHLRAEPEAIPTAIEEVLRYRSPIQCTARIALRNIELGDQQIQAGQRVVAMIGSANRDEAQFPDPERFDISRTPNRHLAFGHGIHFCLGAPLARLEAKIAISLLLQRFHELRRVDDGPLEPIESPLVSGVKHLPMTFRPCQEKMH